MPIYLDQPKKKSFNGIRWLLTTVGLISLLYITNSIYRLYDNASFHSYDKSSKLPPNPFKDKARLKPTNSKAFDILNDFKYREKSLKFLQDAIKIPTEVFDDSIHPNKDLKDWSKFLEFHKYLEKSFPLVFSKLQVTKINKLGLIIEYPGLKPDLKPLVLTAHQDVVPVDIDSLDRWSYPPFDAVFDGEYLWGRGSGDTKSLLIGLFETFELLLQDDFQPNRTIIISAGYDEESIGRYDGAVSLSAWLEEKYGEAYALVDEGGAVSQVKGVENHYFAQPGIVEKGYIDVYFELFVEGGHSSIPFDHSAIGITSDLVRYIENDPYNATLTADNPILYYFRSLAEIEQFDIDDELRHQFLHAQYDDEARDGLLSYLTSSRTTEYTVKTSQAIDIIHAGVKINAIPEYLKLGINHRIALGSTVDDILNNLISKTREISEKFNLDLYLQNNSIIIENDNSQGSFNISWNQPINPSPISNTLGDKTWEIFASSIKSTFEENILPKNSTLDVVPNLVVAYTDSSRYYGLTNNIYRFSGHISPFFNSHAINEHIKFDGHIETIAYLYDYIQTVQEFDS
ncbi:hypothetical protein WICMUC_003129 [Wickerhamomyces mucosus]|uniref:Peptidase M20 dimerisation domain-containing protein n=1 Tax=Wickerhamomyces mucosus TaxID=1378264 RepID=A0A9P8TCN1_9ASCO|nr:hypothetical protein WICMUC_003129 [Wickerhamomyces mucosus]